MYVCVYYSYKINDAFDKKLRLIIYSLLIKDELLSNLY